MKPPTMNMTNIPARDFGQRHGGKSGRRRNDRGFALVVTITLMVLLSVLAMGMLSLSAVQLQAGGYSKDLSTARANARMALMMAIGQLQERAGDDRRVTVAADQLSEDSEGADTSAAANRSHWTGVYKSWGDGLETRPEPEFVGWLVSGEHSLTNSLDFATSSGAAGELVELVGEGTLGPGANGNVEAPLMPVNASDGKTTGKLAWWTGDQGVKATFALPEPQLET